MPVPGPHLVESSCFMSAVDKLRLRRRANPTLAGGSDDEAACADRCGQERLSVMGRHLAHPTDEDDA